MKSIFKKIITNILFLESKLILKKYKPYIIAVTGSVGKTSTKDAIYSLISSNLKVRKSEKSFNSEIGVPLTILGVANAWSDPVAWLKNIFYGLELIFFKFPYPECLVVEVGADHPNDIKNVAKWLKPDIAVLTKVGSVPVHVEFFPSIESLLLEKFQLPKALKKDGIFIFSNDDIAIKSLAPAIERKQFTFAIDNNADLTAKDESILYEERDGLKFPIGISFNLNLNNTNHIVKLEGVIGKQHIYPILGAVSVAIQKNIPIENIINNISKHIPPRGRMNIIKGINDSTIIDDTYNSSPDALHEAINTLKKIETSGRKILVIGDMMELGQYSKSEHEKIRGAMNGGVFDVITVGQRAKVIARTTKNDKSFNNSIEAGEYMKSIITKGDIVLVKGSQSMRMERVTKSIMLNPEKAPQLLVRQDPEWLAKE
jgi:UDP-N-acetylmuramoyl-tripeptide--D-alanyl-D-alanine ligase